MNRKERRKQGKKEQLQTVIVIPAKRFIDKVRIRDYWEVRRNYIVEEFENYMYIEKRIKNDK